MVMMIDRIRGGRNRRMMVMPVRMLLFLLVITAIMEPLVIRTDAEAER